MLANTWRYSKAYLNAIATRALVDEEFKLGVLYGSRSKKIGEYPLPETIQQKILDIQAKDISQFIQGLYTIIDK